MEEKRSYPRNCIAIPIKCLCRFKEDENLSLSLDGVTADISETGICFYTERNLADCSKIEMRSSNWSKPRKGKIMCQMTMPDMGIYKVGVSLQHEDLQYATREEPVKTF